MKTELKFHRVAKKLTNLAKQEIINEPQNLVIAIESCPEVTDMLTIQIRQILNGWVEE